MRHATRVFLALSSLSFFLLFCKNDAPAEKKLANTPKGGHARMVAILDSIADYADPKDCYNLNSKKAAQLKQQWDNAAPKDKLTMQLRYADQILKAGKNEAAIMEFQDIVTQFNDQLSPQNKQVYELLALAYLRLGEQQNCINTHESESCVLPIQG